MMNEFNIKIEKVQSLDDTEALFQDFEVPTESSHNNLRNSILLNEITPKIEEIYVKEDYFMEFSLNSIQESNLNVAQDQSQNFSTVSHKRKQFQKCYVCNKLFSSKKRLKLHLHSIHADYTCYTCGAVFGKKFTLKRHIYEIHFTQRTYECDLCKKSFVRKKSILDHIQRIHLKTFKLIKPYKCSSCFKRFESDFKLKEHQKLHLNEKLFKCDMCFRKFSKKYNLSKHLQLVHYDEDGNFIQEKENKERKLCESCGHSFKDNKCLATHIFYKHVGTRPFQCDYCATNGIKNNFATKFVLTRHIQRHLDEKPYTCSICKAGFIRENAFVAHMDKHSRGVSVENKKKPLTLFPLYIRKQNYCKSKTVPNAYECPICHKIYDTNCSAFAYHMKTHEEKQHKCDICDKSFTLLSTLKIHIRKHTKEKPCKCNICFKNYVDPSSLAKHKKRIHCGIRKDKRGKKKIIA